MVQKIYLISKKLTVQKSGEETNIKFNRFAVFPYTKQHIKIIHKFWVEMYEKNIFI